ncbi:MAG: hypothetical protein P0Y64_05770 [Candidatus Sphingomonas colombiensis]|nr:hypothetical protein [Sphingomonas sp.]WEK44316.1 MAG: hypothetical protein P0Y64_05770 [Sphingomonas sp.]
MAANLKQTRELLPIPVTQIKFASGVDCETVRRLRRLMTQSLDCNYARCAEGEGKWWYVGDVGTGPAEPFDPDASGPRH